MRFTADDAERFLLAKRLLVEASAPWMMMVDRIAVRMDLKFDAEPSRCLRRALVATVSAKNEERAFCRRAGLVEALEEQIKFQIEHRLQNAAPG